MFMYILDDQNEPVRVGSAMQWAHWLEKNLDRRQVARDKFGDIVVSTVFLGLDHSFGGGSPLLYETMIFGGAHDQYQTRCSTREQALEMHKEALRLMTISLSANVIDLKEERGEWTSETKSQD